jgi:tetratricopeptide (TPR) repeat protein
MQHAIQLCEVDHPTLACKLLNRLGFLYRLNRQFPSALETHARALQIAEAAGEEFERVYAYFFLSDDYYASKDYVQATSYGQMAVAGFEHLAARGPELAGTYNTLGLIATEQGHHTLAEQHFTQALALWQACGKREKQIHTMSNLALAFLKQGQHARALTWIDDALHLLAATPNPILSTHLRLMKGTIYFEMREYPQAEQAFLQIDTLFLQQTGLLWHLGVVFNNLGNVALETEQYFQAATYLAEAIVHFRQVEDGLNLANSLGDLARARASQGNGAEARAHYDEALGLLLAYPQNEWARNLQAKFTEARQRLAS